MSQTCVFCSRPKSSRTPGRNNVLTSSLHVIERYALNDKGVVGSLYDARTDNLLPALSVINVSFLTNFNKETPACKLIIVDDSNRNNLLQMMDIQDDLRVSIALAMTKVTDGTLLLNAYELPANRTIRLIDYYHIYQEAYLFNDIRIARKVLPDSLSDNSATHIVTSVKQGIDFVIVFELPENEDYNEIDPVLEKLCEYFTKPEAALLATKDQQKLNRLKTTIFTQITDIHSFAKSNNLSDICRYIHRSIIGYRQKVPLSYTLHPVKCLYYENPCDERIFLQLDQWIIQKMEQKIVSLCSKLKTLNHLFHDKVLPHLSLYVQTSIEDTYAKISRVNDMYTGVQHSLARIIIEFRRGKSDLPLLDKELNGAEIKTLESELEALQTTILELQAKAVTITKSETDHPMKYDNVAGLENSNIDQQHAAKSLPSSVPLRTDGSTTAPNELNILLIGETGVGKSTFINAFVNYLAFHAFDEAIIGKPIVLIPVSFLITIGDRFEEHKIEFGQFDSNEDHNHPGQSVTQHCKSYIFNIGNNTKLRIIDTPGIGDTRGAEQDNKNIEHILSYTNNISHLNAICFLLKPNITRLHALFRSCFTQLFNFLGPNARENIIFCFTNTRATFYTPGDTITLLKKMLNELPNDRIPLFVKENTFCFDSESFRYLAVIRTGHKLALDDNQKRDFENSWTISATESIRLLNFIESRPKYQMNEWHSIKHAQMMSTLLVRPILETIRNALRNLVLWELGNKQHIIELKAQPISLSTQLCTGCLYKTTQIDNMSIMTHSVHNNHSTSNKCDTCHYVSDKHLSVLYDLEYHSGGIKGTGFYLETEKIKNRLHYGTLLLSQFLLHTANISQNPFLTWFDLFIKEEEYLCSNDSSSTLNSEFCKRLYNEKDKYVDGLKDVRFDDELLKLDAVYDCIDEMLIYPIISEQMNAIRKSQMEMMKTSEHDVSSQYPYMGIQYKSLIYNKREQTSK